MEVKFKKNDNKKSENSPDFFLEFSDPSYTGAAWSKVRKVSREGFKDEYLSCNIDRRVDPVKEPDWKETAKQDPGEPAF